MKIFFRDILTQDFIQASADLYSIAVLVQVLGAATPRPTAESQILDLHKGHFIKKFEFSLYTSFLLYGYKVSTQQKIIFVLKNWKLKHQVTEILRKS